MTSNELPEWLLAKLNELGLSQRQLAARAGVSQGTISHIINGTRRAGADVCVSLARAFNIPPETVLHKAGILPTEPEPASRMVRNIRNIAEILNDKQKEELLNYAKYQLQQQKK